MRTVFNGPSFFGGLVVGAVVALTLERVLRRHARGSQPLEHFIDGARPPSAAELGARPGEESHLSSPHLMSEAPDVEPDTQRW